MKTNSPYFLAYTVAVTVGLLFHCTSGGSAQAITIDHASVGDTICCISVTVLTDDEARELSRLGIGQGRQGTFVARFSDLLLRELRAGGFDIEVTCYELTERVALNRGVHRIFMGAKTTRKAGRPMVALSTGVGGNSILFLDSDLSQIAAKEQGIGPVISKSCEYVGTVYPGKNLMSGKWQVFDRSGGTVVEAGIKTFGGTGEQPDPNERILMDTGGWIEVHAGEIPFFSFYDSSGRLMKKASFPGRLDLHHEGSFSDDGRFFALQRTHTDPVWRNQITLFDSDANEVWTFEPVGQTGTHRHISISQDGSHVVGSFQSADGTSTYILGRNGHLIMEIPGFCATESQFLSSQYYVILSGLYESGSALLVVRLRSGTVEFLQRPGSVLSKLDFAERAGFLAFAKKNHMSLVGLDGRDKWLFNLPWLGENIGEISLSDNGVELSVAAGNIFMGFTRVTPKLYMVCEDVPPKPTHLVLPEYPMIARHAGIQGTLLVRLLVGADGSVLDAHVEKKIHRTLDDASVEAAEQWKFAPTKRETTWVTVPIRFSLFGGNPYGNWPEDYRPEEGKVELPWPDD